MVSQTKIELVQQLTDLVNSHSVIAVVDFESLPAQQLQTMKAKLRAQNVTVVMARKRLLARALQESKQEKIAEMVEHLVECQRYCSLTVTRSQYMQHYKRVKVLLQHVQAQSHQKISWYQQDRQVSLRDLLLVS